MIDVTDNNAVYYYHFDGLGSVVALSNTSAKVVERYIYDVFGEPNTVSDVNNPYLFTGRRYDNETALYYYRARYYEPYIGRFLQADPIGYADSMNLYTYVGNNPVNFVDPVGLISIGAKIRFILGTRMGPPSAGLVNHLLRANEYTLHDKSNEMKGLLGPQMNRYYDQVVRNFDKEKGLGSKWQRINFDQRLPGKNWKLTDKVKYFGDTSYWLNQAWWVEAKGSLEARKVEGILQYRNVNANWTWYDAIDANTYLKLIKSKHPWWYVPLEGTWDLLADKLMDVDFKVKIKWKDS